MSSHFPIIIPEINDKESICDYLFQTASILAKKNHPTYIYYLNQAPTLKNNLSKISSHLYSFTPLKIIPLNRFRVIQQINIHLSFIYLYFLCIFRHHLSPVFWFFYPQTSSLLKFSPPPKKLIYDIVDFYTSPDSKINKSLNQQKKYLLINAHLITAISQSLIKNYQKILSSALIHLVPQGFNLIKSDSSFHPEIKKLQKLTHKIGFIGGINNRLDFRLLFKLIPHTPQYNYIFIGPFGHDANVSPKPVDKLAKKLLFFKNVYHINLVPKSQIGQFINIFDITIIPYDIKDDFNRLCYPMKLFEYFSAGKPVISTPIEELKNFPKLVYISSKASDWKKYIHSIFSKPWPKSNRLLSQKLATDNCWQNKVNQILKLLPQ
jgi:glycosyltransferase involved in cell wall biosynthesis